MALHMLLERPVEKSRGELVMLCGHTESYPFYIKNPYTNDLQKWLNNEHRCMACVQEMHRRLPLSTEDVSMVVATREPTPAVTHLWDALNHDYCAGEVGFYDHHAANLEAWAAHPSPCHACLVAVLKLLRVAL